jgi:hypothetical protein
MHNHARMIATLAAGALLVAPASGLAAKGAHGSAAKGKAKSCATTPKVAYQVSGTLLSATLDDPATTGVNEASVTLKVTSANVHATRSGEIADQNATKKGVQVKGATMTIAATDAFTLKLNGYAGSDTPSLGDRVKVSGRIPVTKKSCAAAGTTTADRYAAPDVKRVTISDRDPDA